MTETVSGFKTGEQYVDRIPARLTDAIAMQAEHQLELCGACDTQRWCSRRITSCTPFE